MMGWALIHCQEHGGALGLVVGLVVEVPVTSKLVLELAAY